MNTHRFPRERVLHLRISDALDIDLICTGSDLEPLVIGYLYNEGLIHRLEDVSAFELSDSNLTARVELRGPIQPPSARIRPSGFGGQLLCSDSVLPPAPIQAHYPMRYIQSCAQHMDSLAVQYQETGGVHCSALFTPCQMLSFFEDIGRHNTLDKLTGYCLMHGLHAEDTLLITTGRVSSEMLRKAACLGASLIASYSVPTQRAFELAQALNITLVGYLNKAKAAVYTVPERVC